MEKRILDEETRKTLYGYLPFSVGSSIEFIPDQFKSISDESLRPVFSIRSLKQSEKIQLQINYSDYNRAKEKDKDEILIKTSFKNLSIIRSCVTGWKNLFDCSNGNEIEFATDENGACTVELWDMLPDWIKTEIFTFVQKISCLSVPDKTSLE